MKVLIQNCITGCFLGPDDLWCESPDQARNFGTSATAIAHYMSHRHPDVQVVLHFDYDPQLNVRLTLSETCRDGQFASEAAGT